MDDSRGKNIYEFADFRLDAAHLLLYRNGREVSLAPKVVETLLALIERSGEILSKEELMRIVWADSFVEESNLSQNLYLLRKFLPEKSNGKPLIETLKRRGYRFNAKVSRIKARTEKSSGETRFNAERNEAESTENQTQTIQPQNAFEACQMARIYFQKMTLAGMIESRELLEQAIRFDAGYAPAYVALAEQCIKETIVGLCSPADGSAGARRALQSASDLGADSAEFYTAKGYADLVFDWDFPVAESNLRKSLEINPHYAIANNYLGQTFMSRRRFKEAEFYIKRSVEIEPLGLYCRGVLQILYFLSGRYEESLEAGKKQLEMFPSYIIAAVMRCWSLEQTGRVKEAVAEYEKIIQKPESDFAGRWIGYAYAIAGDRENALKTADSLIHESLEHYVSPIYAAMIYAALNQPDQATICLETALAQRDPWLIWTAADPRYDNLRSNTRFQSLQKTVFEKAS